jgi:sugar diacid utilization regulator
MNLPILKAAELVAGKDGLKKEVTWVHVVELPNIEPWINYGELIFLTGVGLKNYKEELVNIVRDIAKKNGSGLFIGVGPFIKEIPEEVVKVGDELAIPIFKIPFEVKVIDITQSICKMIFYNLEKIKSMKDLMNEIMFSELKEDITERASFYGYDAEKNYRAMVINIESFKNTGQKEKNKEESFLISMKSTIENIVKSTFGKHNKKILYEIRQNSFIVMAPVKEANNNSRELESLANIIKGEINEKIKDITINIGIGNCYSGLKDFKQSVYQADKALKILKKCRRVNTVRQYSELGIYRILFKSEDIDELKNIYIEALGPLIEQDMNFGTDLLNTLEVYLKEDRNLGRAADILFIHRNTMKYRLSKINEILDYNFEDAILNFNIQLAYKIKRFFEL